MYTDVFGNSTLPPAEYGFAAFTLTSDATFVWPYNSDNVAYTIAKIMDVSCESGNSLVLPDATDVSTGEDFLIRNIGANTLVIKDASGVQIATVAPGAASYFYLTSNPTSAGVFGVIGFGVGTSSVDASSLVGYGIKAIGSSLNQSHPVVTAGSGVAIGSDYRSKLIVFTGGTDTFTLVSAASLGDDYFTMFRNEGTGTATIDPAASETIDGAITLQVQPGESLMLICTGAQWYSVGYGRSTLYQFTQLTKDVSAGGTITLTATEASNKLITFIGNPAANLTVIVPSVVAVYYVFSSISTARLITLKTLLGSGVDIPQGARIIALCDGTNVLSAQSAVANASVSLSDGSAATPSLYFASQTNTGLYKSGVTDFGATVDGVSVATFTSAGLVQSNIGANSTQRHTIPAVASDTLALVTSTQTLANKTINLANNTLSGTLAQFNTACSDADFSTTSGAEVLTNKTIALGNNAVSGTTAQFNTALTDNDFATLAGSESLTNKTFNLSNNTLTGTLAQFNTACSDADFSTTSAVEVLTNKTISGTSNTLTNIGNGSLTNSTITINGSAISLGGSTTVVAGSLIPVIVAGISQAAVAGNLYVLTNVATTTLTLPAVPNNGDIIAVMVANGLTTNIVERNGKNILGAAEDLILDNGFVTVTFEYIDSTYMWRII